MMVCLRVHLNITQPPSFPHHPLVVGWLTSRRSVMVMVIVMVMVMRLMNLFLQ